MEWLIVVKLLFIDGQGFCASSSDRLCEATQREGGGTGEAKQKECCRDSNIGE